MQLVSDKEHHQCNTHQELDGGALFTIVDKLEGGGWGGGIQSSHHLHTLNPVFSFGIHTKGKGRNAH